MLFEAGRTNDAVREYREAIRLAPDELMLHVGLGNRLLDFDRFDEAEAEMREAVRLQTGFPARSLYAGKSPVA